MSLNPTLPTASQGEPSASVATERRRPGRAGLPSASGEQRVLPLRKPVNTLAIVPKSHKITALARKSYNVLLHEAQSQGLDKDVFSVPLERIVRGVDFDSNDQALIKKHLRAMVSTTVEWQSPTTGEGASWNVSGLLAHARLSKLRGQVWVEWSYAVNLKQELLEPTVFARLSLEVISQLRSHAGIALYEICSRYKDIGRTSRQAWQWWRPVLTGRPDDERTAKLEYRIFKRDTLKPAIAEVSAITDLEVELVEYKQGRFISDLQFLIRRKPQQAPSSPSAPQAQRAPEPVDLSVLARARALGVDDARSEELIDAHGVEAVRRALESLARRLAHAWPEPLRDPGRYLKALLAGGEGASAAAALPSAADVSAGQAAPGAQPAPGSPGLAVPSEAERIEQQRRQARWTEAWRAARRQRLVDDIAALPEAEQARLCELLAEDMAERAVHPSIRKRLASSGWLHPLVLPEMVRFYAHAAIGEHWDQPSSAQLLEVAAQLGDADAAPRRG